MWFTKHPIDDLATYTPGECLMSNNMAAPFLPEQFIRTSDTVIFPNTENSFNIISSISGSTQHSYNVYD